MKKINPTKIVLSHLATLRDFETGKILIGDLLVFFAAPMAIGLALWWCGHVVPKEVFGNAASTFGIFAGLLINVQVAIFGIFLRKWDNTNDAAAKDVLSRREGKRRAVLRELNANIAYLILFCSASIIVTVILSAIKNDNPICTAILSILFVHLILTFLMTSKRAFMLFDAEYHRS